MNGRGEPPGPYQRHLRAWRERRGLTLEQVAAALSRDPPARPTAHSTVQRWETGETPLDSHALVGLCRVYEATPDQLLRDLAEEERQVRAREIAALTDGLDPGAVAALRDFLGCLRRA